MSRRDRPSRNRKRAPVRPSRGQQRNKRGDGGFHHWRIPLASGGMHDVHISDGIPFEAHQFVLEHGVAPHLERPQAITDKGFLRSEFSLGEFGRLTFSTDPKHNETWVWRE